MDRYNRLLVVVEPSDTAARVLARAILIARYTKSRIDLLLAARSDGAAAGERFLTGLLASVVAEGVPIRPYVRTGNSLADIVGERQRKQPADLILKHPNGRDGAGRGLWNSNDWQLLRACEAPLLLTQGTPWHPQPRFAAATDESGAKAGAGSPVLSALKYLASTLDAQAEVLTMATPGAPGLAALVATAAEKDVDLLLVGTHSLRQEWREHLSTLATQLPGKLACDVLVIDGEPRSAAQPAGAISPESSTMRTS
jgi:nucleotide-binding universal stress UspA family protein